MESQPNEKKKNYQNYFAIDDDENFLRFSKNQRLVVRHFPRTSKKMNKNTLTYNTLHTHEKLRIRIFHKGNKIYLYE